MINQSSDQYDAVIIGAGLGGLLCANILSREGFKVCVLEKNHTIGGSIQSFSRKGVVFNTGLNFTESLGEGETLYKYFKFFNIYDELNIRRMDIDAFEKITFRNDPNIYPFAQGQDNFVDKLSGIFPSERKNLQRYIEMLKEVCSSFPLYSLNTESVAEKHKYLEINAYDYLKDLTSVTKLQHVLAGINSLYAGEPNNTPFYVHALINHSFMRSSWRLVDGSTQLISAITKNIISNGGQVYNNTEVLSINGTAANIEYVETSGGTKVFGKYFISNLHPLVTINLIKGNLIKRGYKQRITNMRNTIGMFTVYAVLKKEKFPYMNYNHHHFSKENSWTTDYDKKDWPAHFMFYTPAISSSEKWAESAIIITYMKWEEVQNWYGTSVGRRGQAYQDFKRNKAELLIDEVNNVIPGFKQSIDSYYTSTPLTYQNYTSTPEGSAYGILKNSKDPLSTLISPRSRIPNLLNTGQNLNMHGILGVSIGAFSTCAELVGYDYLLKKLKSY